VSLPIIAGAALTGLGAFIAGIVMSALGAVVVLRSVSYNSQKQSVMKSHNGGVP
jgi:cell division protein FtsX